MHRGCTMNTFPCIHCIHRWIYRSAILFFLVDFYINSTLLSYSSIKFIFYMATAKQQAEYNLLFNTNLNLTDSDSFYLLRSTDAYTSWKTNLLQITVDCTCHLCIEYPLKMGYLHKGLSAFCTWIFCILHMLHTVKGPQW